MERVIRYLETLRPVTVVEPFSVVEENVFPTCPSEVRSQPFTDRLKSAKRHRIFTRQPGYLLDCGHGTCNPAQAIEVIVDTCSMGEKKMRGVSAMPEHAMHRSPRVFEDYRIVVPLQLGTEARQRMFAEFLEMEFALSTKEHGLDAFAARHKDHVRIVETTSSKAFTFYYAQRAAYCCARTSPCAKWS